MSYSVAPAPGSEDASRVSVVHAAAALRLRRYCCCSCTAAAWSCIGDLRDRQRPVRRRGPRTCGRRPASAPSVGPIVVVGSSMSCSRSALVVLGMLVGKGKNPARIDHLGRGRPRRALLRLRPGQFGTAMLSGLGNAPDQEVLDEIAAATPGWLTASTMAAADHLAARPDHRHRPAGDAGVERLLPQGAGGLGAADRRAGPAAPPAHPPTRHPRRRRRPQPPPRGPRRPRRHRPLRRT